MQSSTFSQLHKLIVSFPKTRLFRTAALALVFRNQGYCEEALAKNFTCHLSSFEGHTLVEVAEVGSEGKGLKFPDSLLITTHGMADGQEICNS